MSSVQEAVAGVLEETAKPLKLDIGCGKNKKEGFYGVDIIDFEGVDLVADLRQKTWSFRRVPEELRPRLNITLIRPADKEMVEWSLVELPDNSVDEVHCAHFLEHLTNLDDKWERVNFFNELYRVLKPGAQATLIFPHWCSNRYYGDPTHKEPFSEMGFLYLWKEWRLGGTQRTPVGNAPHTDISVNPNGYSCDFDFGQGYGLHPALINRNQDYQQHALAFWKEAASDIIATLTKPSTPR